MVGETRIPFSVLSEFFLRRGVLAPPLFMLPINVNLKMYSLRTQWVRSYVICRLQPFGRTLTVTTVGVFFCPQHN